MSGDIKTEGSSIRRQEGVCLIIYSQKEGGIRIKDLGGKVIERINESIIEKSVIEKSVIKPIDQTVKSVTAKSWGG